MSIKPIRTKADYKAALKRVEELMDARPGTPEDDELDVLATLVDVYEEERFPIDPPDPIDAILFRMEQMDLTRKDLEPSIGASSRVSEVLNRRRPLSLAMIRSLHEHLGIPLDILARASPEQSGTPRGDSSVRRGFLSEVGSRRKKPSSRKESLIATSARSPRKRSTASA